MTRDFTRVAKKYARDVLTGKILACQQIHRACERFEADLKSKKWVYDKAKAHRACAIIELFPHVEGELAGELIRLEPWQVFAIVNIFGLVDKRGYRKHREAFLLIPRKNGKSTLAAAIALVMAFADDEEGAQVWIGANSEKQANYCFKPVQRMAARSGLAEHGVEVRANSVECEASNSFIQRMIGKPGDGGNPHCAILDEFHEADTPDAYDTMKTGMGARRQPLLLSITTAGVNTAGPCKQLQSYAEGVLSGLIADSRLFAMIFTTDPKDDWRDIKTWRKANPNYGVSLSDEFFEKTLAEAIARPEKAAIAQTKHLNVWVSSRSAWLNLNDWAKGSAEIDIERDLKGRLVDLLLGTTSLRGCKATIGLDLATKTDIAALVARIISPTGKIVLVPFLFLPESAVERSKNSESYRQWVEAEKLVVTDGNATDFAEIEATVRELCALLDVDHIGVDQWQAEHMMQRLLADRLPVMKCPANVKTFAPAMMEFEAALRAGRYVHPGNPAFTWMAGNVVAKADARGNLYPRKPDGQDHLKIDGIVATLMAEAVAMAPEETPATAPLFAVWGV